MTWTADHIEALYQSVYRNVLTCPACGGQLKLARAQEPGAIGVVRCDSCDERHLVSTQNDPLRTWFRDYTEQERKEIVSADNVRRTPLCPVDGTPMDVHAQRSLGRTSNADVRCRRCGRGVVFVRAHG
jgi:hypothetical protein